LAVVERLGVEKPYRYHVRQLERWPLGTSYQQIVIDLSVLLTLPDLRDKALLALDRSGVGRAVFDYVQAAKLPCQLRSITITGGHAATWDKEEAHHWLVPKKDLISVLAVLLENGRLVFEPGISYGDVMKRELLAMQAKKTASQRDRFEAREGEHDDLVLALAIAGWCGEQGWNVRRAQPLEVAGAVWGVRR
jgi:hypothetical protein